MRWPTTTLVEFKAANRTRNSLSSSNEPTFHLAHITIPAPAAARSGAACNTRVADDLAEPDFCYFLSIVDFAEALIAIDAIMQSHSTPIQALTSDLFQAVNNGTGIY